MEQAQGYIVKVRNDNKGVQLDNKEWYANKFKEDLDLKEGEFVKISFVKNKDFNNYTEIKKEEAPEKPKRIKNKLVAVISAENEFELAKKMNEDQRNVFASQTRQKIDGSWVAFIFYYL